MPRRLVQRARDDEHVGFRREVVNAGEVSVRDGILARSRVVADGAAESLESLRDLWADVPQADDADTPATDLGAERVAVPLHAPEAAADEPLGGRHATEHVDEQADGVVGDVGGEHPAGVGDNDAAARALVQVDEVNARRQARDAAEGRDGVEERGVHGDQPRPHDDGGTRRLRGGRCGGEEGRERRALGGGEEVEDAEAPAQRGVEGRVHVGDEKEDDLRSRGLAAGLHHAGRRRRRGGRMLVVGTLWVIGEKISKLNDVETWKLRLV